MQNNIEFPTIGKAVYTSPNNANIIYEATYQGKPCYCIQYHHTEHIELFDYDNAILKAVISKIKRCGSTGCNKDRKGRYRLVFSRTAKEDGISLRLYLFSKYHGLTVKAVKEGCVRLVDDTLRPYNIADLRKDNLYQAGAFRPEKGSCTIRVHDDPNDTNRKCIAVTCQSALDERTETYDYSEPFYQMLSCSKWCIISCASGSRITVAIHNKKFQNSYKTINLSKFALLYTTHYIRYQNRKGAIKQFMRDIPNLLANEPREAGHVNALTWNGGNANLLWMEGRDNKIMKNIIACFSGEYNAFPVTNGAGEILIELTAHEETHYYKCNTPKEYLDFQMVLMGRSSLTKNVDVTHITQHEAIHVPTPKETYKKPTPVEDAVSSYWEWCNHRDWLLDKYADQPDSFKPWHCISNGIALTDTEAICELITLFSGEVIRKIHA